MNARQLCNYCLALLLDGRDAEAREEFLQGLEESVSPSQGTAEAAIEQLRQAREAAGGVYQ